MRKQLYFVMIVCLSLVFSACGSNGNTGESTALANNEYAAILPYESSDTRVKHVGLISDADTRVQIETGLMDLSKTYFSPNDVSFKTQKFLDFDELDATDGSRGLLGTLRDDNPNGLNPGTDEEFDTGNGTVKGAVILIDIYELDWYANDNLQGISIGLVINNSVGDDDIEIEDEQLQAYLQVTSEKLVNYMQSRFNEVTASVPIYICAYELADDNTDSLGGYVYSGYFRNNTSQYQEIDEEWVRCPSTALSTKSPKVYEEFTAFVDDLDDVIADDTYVVGSAKFEGDDMAKLEINITAHGKTAGEMLAVAQAARESLSGFSSSDCTYTVNIVDNGTTYCMLKRYAGSKDVTVVSSL